MCALDSAQIYGATYRSILRKEAMIMEHERTSSELTPVIYREGVEADFPAVAAMYAKVDGFLRQHTYAFPEVENVGELWLDIFRRTLGRFSILYVAEYSKAEYGGTGSEKELVGFIVARLKRVPEYLGGVMVGELKDMWVEPRVRHLGIGEELLRMAIGWCRDQKVHSCEAQILMGNEPIIRLIEYLGMKRELYQFRLVWDDYREEGKK
jgi:RimJ/RimL family protein N-acetyltransferase